MSARVWRTAIPEWDPWFSGTAEAVGTLEHLQAKTGQEPIGNSQAGKRNPLQVDSTEVALKK